MSRRAAPPTPTPEGARPRSPSGLDVARKGLWREAAFRFEQAIAKEPNNARAHNNLAVALEADGRVRARARGVQEGARARPERHLHPPQLRALRRVLHVLHPDDRKGRRCAVAPPRGASRALAAPGSARGRCRRSAGVDQVRLQAAAEAAAAAARQREDRARALHHRRPRRRRRATSGSRTSTSRREFQRFLKKQIEKKTKLEVIETPPDLKLPTQNLTELARATGVLARRSASQTGAEIIVSGSLEFRVEDRSGYKTEEYVSPIDGRTYYRQVYVEQTGFLFDIVFLVFDGRTGEKLLQDEFKDFRQTGGRRADELQGLFENLFSLENQILNLFVARDREAERYLFTD